MKETLGSPDELNIVAESARDGVYAHISGKWLKEGVLSKNNNYYSPETVRATVARTQARIERAAAGKGHPVLIMETHDDADSDRATTVVGKITGVWMDGEVAKYSGDIANTGTGRDVAALIMGKFGTPGVSLRADNKIVTFERATHEGHPIRKIGPFEAEGIDLTRRPGLGEFGSVDAIYLLESIQEAEVDDEGRRRRGRRRRG